MALATDKDEDTTPQFKHQKKLIEEETKRQKHSVVVESWVEIFHEPTNKKGGKVRLCQRMKNGNVYRTLLGRKTQVADKLKQLEKQGIKARPAA